MDPKEEQAAELEALEAIFDADFRLVEPATDSSGARFEIDLNDDVTQSVKLRLIFSHTLGYPEEPLQLVVHALEGLSTPRRKMLQTHLEQVARDNTNMPCAYTICEAAKDWTSDNVIGKVAEEEDEDNPTKFETLDSTQHEKVEVISSKAVGTPVSVETFSEWRRQFMLEIDEVKSKEQLDRESNAKMTGREFFESKNVVVTVEGESFWEQEAMAAEATAE